MADLGMPAWLPLSDAVTLVGTCMGGGNFCDPMSSVDTDSQSSFKDEQAPLGYVHSGCAAHSCCKWFGSASPVRVVSARKISFRCWKPRPPSGKYAFSFPESVHFFKDSRLRSALQMFA